MTQEERHLDLISSYRYSKSCYHLYRNGLCRLMDGYGLSVMENDLLLAIYNDPECNTVTRLCSDIGKTKGVVSRACNHLCDKKYFREDIDKIDRRIVHFRLTPQARNLVEMIARYLDAMTFFETVTRSLNGDGISAYADYNDIARVDLKKSLVYPIIGFMAPKDPNTAVPFCTADHYFNELHKELRLQPGSEEKAILTENGLQKLIISRELPLNLEISVDELENDRKIRILPLENDGDSLLLLCRKSKPIL